MLKNNERKRLFVIFCIGYALMSYWHGINWHGLFQDYQSEKKTTVVVKPRAGAPNVRIKTTNTTEPRSFTSMVDDDVFINSRITDDQVKQPCPYADNTLFGGLRNTYLWKVCKQDPLIVFNAHIYACHKVGIKYGWIDYFDVIGMDSRWQAGEGLGKQGAFSAFQFTKVNYKDAGISGSDRSFICSLSLAEQYRYEMKNMRIKLRDGAKPELHQNWFLYYRFNMHYHLANYYDDPNAILYSNDGTYTPISLPEYEDGVLVYKPLKRSKASIIKDYNDENGHNKVMDVNGDGRVTWIEHANKSIELRQVLIKELEVIYTRYNSAPKR